LTCHTLTTLITWTAQLENKVQEAANQQATSVVPPEQFYNKDALTVADYIAPT